PWEWMSHPSPVSRPRRARHEPRPDRGDLRKADTYALGSTSNDGGVSHGKQGGVNTGAGRKLGRPTGHRFQMLRNMATSLLHYEKIETTKPKAREVARITEKLITAAKAGDLAARRRVARDLKNPSVNA